MRYRIAARAWLVAALAFLLASCTASFWAPPNLPSSQIVTQAAQTEQPTVPERPASPLTTLPQPPTQITPTQQPIMTPSATAARTREFRAAWVASVNNIDWPSRPGLSAAELRGEIVRIVERARDIGLNALIVQVRPAADALYPSALEPWSEYLTGAQGLPLADPTFDPLQAWIDEAHARGIELHAWFNPYRARHSSAKSASAVNHVSLTLPNAVRRYGDQLWLDPADAASSAHTRRVILDVLTRYEIDGVHIDDYFYPYPVYADGGAVPRAGIAKIEFPDDALWTAYRNSGGMLSRADWRRDHVNRFVAILFAEIKRVKPQVLFGISPFGIGKPALRPLGIAGFSQFDELYADVELWLAQGWLDYLAPQLYWPTIAAAQPFEPLLRYWQTLPNPRGAAIWPGLFTSKIGDPGADPRIWSPDEILAQIAITRTQSATKGHIHFSMRPLLENRAGIAEALRVRAYAP